ncbi:DUF4405 domain-containing protein [Tropicimonas sp. IMCC6043]|uniref:DUF4405 domain-containing protein n=1 Tax=Tropicimonas sp. IMCC6043 TaxID=2510645 RepID=UPI0013EC0237|nr:DUF4405 domain-containing protein [Tropicimonas sp. IMCC6043]
MAQSIATHTAGGAARLSGRALAAFGVSFSFVVMLWSGLMLYIAPKGRVAQQIGWEIFGLGRDGWEALHIATGLVFVGFVAWHFLVHLRVYKTLLGGTPMHPKGHRREAWLAAAIALFVAIAALQAWPPVQWAIDGNSYLKQVHWAPDGRPGRGTR